MEGKSVGLCLPFETKQKTCHEEKSTHNGLFGHLLYFPGPNHIYGRKCPTHFRQTFPPLYPCAIFDMNCDGLDDIIRLDGGNNLYVNYQENDGSFTEFAFGAIEEGGWGGDAWGMCVGDLNNDGYGDIVAGGAYDDIKTIFSFLQRIAAYLR